ncbi:MAG TPA: MBL fold metallo-hydrolase [Terriglobia bacterium]|nr:MBL fold metallo-hydrolase [Terriglobia bacterium]
MNETQSGDRLKIEFWGVRGSIPTAEENKLRVGGNTPCLLLQHNHEPIVIIDGGTGLHLLGLQLEPCNQSRPVEASILFSHFHWDHIQGLPFFPPMYSAHCALKFYSTLRPSHLKRVLDDQMKQPYFPLPLSAARSRREYNQVQARGCEIGSLRISPVRLNHPGGATGYRIDSAAGSLIYVSDHEHGAEEIDACIAREAAGVDLLIYDSQYTPAEYPGFRGWGHSTWLEGTRLANRAGVGQLLLFHHSPSRTDQEVSPILLAARREFAATDFACENQPISLFKPQNVAKVGS